MNEEKKPSAYYPWFPRKVVIEATPDHAVAFIKDDIGCIEAFLGYILKTTPYVISGFLDDHQEEFDNFVRTSFLEV